MKKCYKITLILIILSVLFFPLLTTGYIEYKQDSKEMGENSKREDKNKNMDWIQIIPSGIFSISALVIAIIALNVSQKAHAEQVFNKYFAFNNFVTNNIEDLGFLVPLGKCESKREANVRLLLYHHLNRFISEKDRKAKKFHKKFSKNMFGNNIKDFYDKLIERGKASEEEANMAVEVLKKIKEIGVDYPDDFWDKFFGPEYFR